MYSPELANWSKGRGSSAAFADLFLDRVEGRAAATARNYFRVGSKVEGWVLTGKRFRWDGVSLGWGFAGRGSRWDVVSLGLVGAGLANSLEIVFVSIKFVM